MIGDPASDADTDGSDLVLAALPKLGARHPHPHPARARLALDPQAGECIDDQLLEAIRRVYRGGKYVSPTLAEQLASQLDAGGERPPHELLSDREFEVMRRLGSGLTVSQIAAELGISAKTVSTYRTRILEKMAVSNNADLVRYASTHGLIG